MAATDVEDVSTQVRLDWFLAQNAETARLRAAYRSDLEKMEAELMKYPIPAADAYAYFGSFLGGIPLFTLTLRSLFEDTNTDSSKVGLLVLMFVVAAASSAAGFVSGKVVGPIALKIERFRWSTMLPLLPVIGFIWGAVAGTAGGLLAFGIGAIFGFFIGGFLGTISVPLFVIVHRLMKRGESIELRHFLPLSFGIVLVLCAFIFSM